MLLQLASKCFIVVMLADLFSSEFRSREKFSQWIRALGFGLLLGLIGILIEIGEWSLSKLSFSTAHFEMRKRSGDDIDRSRREGLQPSLKNVGCDVFRIQLFVLLIQSRTLFALRLVLWLPREG